jgi:hypothetical protein
MDHRPDRSRRAKSIGLTAEHTGAGGPRAADPASTVKTEAGFVKVAGIELVLLDAVRYFHQAAGLNGSAQIVHDLGGKAVPRVLANVTAAYENSTARRLGYLLEHFFTRVRQPPCAHSLAPPSR